MAGLRWTEDENRKLMEYYFKGYDNKKIAELLGRTEHAITNQRNYLDLNDSYKFEWDSITYNYLIYQLRKMENLKLAQAHLGLCKKTIKNKIIDCVKLGYLNKCEARSFLDAI